MATEPGRSVASLADRTPAQRDRVVDAMRAGSIVVVVVWHWSLSINHRDDDGVLRNPNPISEVPLGWVATWLLQVMPVFFLVGGFANHRGWRSVERDGGRARDFWQRRARRLLPPIAVFLVAWGAIEVVGHLFVGDYRSVVEAARIVFVPLWFVAAYIWVVVLVPVTASLHDRQPLAALAIGVAVIGAVDIVRFAADIDAAGWVNAALVWVVIHQLGYFWSDGTLTDAPRRRPLLVAAVGLIGLAALTSLDTYPGSIVATADDDVSHMYPPTVVLAVLAAFQLGVITAAHDRLRAVVERRRPWMAVFAVNAVIITIFLWHMTALLGSVLIFEALGGTLGDEPTASWWLTRPLWVIGPAVVLLPLIGAFAVIETGRRR